MQSGNGVPFTVGHHRVNEHQADVAFDLGNGLPPSQEKQFGDRVTGDGESLRQTRAAPAKANGTHGLGT
jgi:hypothetical protein